MSKWILALVMALTLTLPAVAKDKDKDKDRDNSQNSSNVEDLIKKLTEQNRQAALKGDTDWVEKHTDPNYVSVGANGAVSDRYQVVQRMKSGSVKYDAIDIQDQKVQVFGNTAVVDSEAHVKATSNGQPIDGEFRATHVWVKEGNDWKLVSFQATPVQSPTPAAAPK